MSVEACTRSLQKYVNIFLSRGQVFDLFPPIFDATVNILSFDTEDNWKHTMFDRLVHCGSNYVKRTFLTLRCCKIWTIEQQWGKQKYFECQSCFISSRCCLPKLNERFWAKDIEFTEYVVLKNKRNQMKTGKRQWSEEADSCQDETLVLIQFCEKLSTPLFLPQESESEKEPGPANQIHLINWLWASVSMYIKAEVLKVWMPFRSFIWRNHMTSKRRGIWP